MLRNSNGSRSLVLRIQSAVEISRIFVSAKPILAISTRPAKKFATMLADGRESQDFDAVPELGRMNERGKHNAACRPDRRHAVAVLSKGGREVGDAAEYDCRGEGGGQTLAIRHVKAPYPGQDASFYSFKHHGERSQLRVGGARPTTSKALPDDIADANLLKNSALIAIAGDLNKAEAIVLISGQIHFASQHN
jgi:hypothetical protein